MTENNSQIEQVVTPLKKIRVFHVILLSFVTLGLYYPFWFLKRRGAINNMQSTKKLQKKPLFSAIALWFVIVFVAFSSGIIQNDGNVTASESLMLFAQVLNLVYVIILIGQSLKVRSIFDEHFNNHLRKEMKFSKIATFFFQILYLQYKINKL